MNVFRIAAALALMLASSATAAPPTATVTLLDGNTLSGALLRLNAQGLALSIDGADREVAVDELLQVELSQDIREASGIAVRLADSSRIHVKSIVSDGTTVSLDSADLGALSLPQRQLAEVRFSPVTDSIAASWQDLQTRATRDDLLVIRKGEVLDYAAGSVGAISDGAVTILVRDRNLSAPLERIFGILFASQNSSPSPQGIRVRTLAGDEILAESLELKDDSLQATSASLGSIAIPVPQLKLLDYGGGRIRALADLPYDPSGCRSPSADNDILWFVAKNAPAGSGGRSPLVIGNQEYRKGLWLHSGAVLRYRLNREFAQLRATAGFDLTHVGRMPQFNPRVRLKIQGDGQELYSKEFHWNDPPEQLDVSLQDVRELTIEVESLGAMAGILEHFALGDAQVIQ